MREGTLAEHPTYFETMTAAAFWHFRTAAGRGGRARGGPRGPARRHERRRAPGLGDGEPRLRPRGVPGCHPRCHRAGEGGRDARRPREVLGPVPEEAHAALERRPAARCARGSSRPARACASKSAGAASTVPLLPPPGPACPCPALTRRDNLLVALRMLEEAQAARPAPGPRPAARGTRRHRWPGRLQRLQGRPPLLLDGAHNPAGARALAADLRTAGPFVLLFGVMADKDVRGLAAELFPLADEVVLTKPRGGPRRHPRRDRARARPRRARRAPRGRREAGPRAARQQAGPGRDRGGGGQPLPRRRRVALLEKERRARLSGAEVVEGLRRVPVGDARR